MSQLTLDAQLLRWTIKHILRHGDTDVFPYPFEFRFFDECADDIARSLSEINLHTYRPVGLLQSLYPKSRYGFRLAHQIHLVDTILITAAIARIGSDLEKARAPITSGRAYAYRFVPDQNGNMFSDKYKFHNWLLYQRKLLGFGDRYRYIVKTDIADFYQRIYHHRLENCLLQCLEHTSYSQYGRFILNVIRDYNARESFGLPVGGNASRLLAEIALCDTDNALKNAGYPSTRYVDDIVMFIRDYEDPYGALAFLAEHLATNEGLSLSASKTKVYSAEEYASELDHLLENQTEEGAAEHLYYRAYDSEEIDESAVEHLRVLNLAGELEEEFAKEFWDVGKIRILLRALRLTRSREAVDFIKNNFIRLIPFCKDVVLLLEELRNDGDESFVDFGDIIVSTMLGSVGERLDVVRAWLFELFIREVTNVSYGHLRRLDGLKGTLDSRQAILLRSKIRDINYFRSGKKRIMELNDWVKPVFVWGARCLPYDEYSTWVRNIRGRVAFPLSDLFCDWALKQAR